MRVRFSSNASATYPAVWDNPKNQIVACGLSNGTSGVPYKFVLDQAKVLAHCREHLASYKVPKQVFVVESLPRNPLGKLLRGQLAGTSGPGA